MNRLADVGYINWGCGRGARNGSAPMGRRSVVQRAFLLALDSHFAYHLTD